MDPLWKRKIFEAVLDYQFDMLWRRGMGEGHADFLYAHGVSLLRQSDDLRTWFQELVQYSTSRRAPVIDRRTLARPEKFVPESFILYAAHATRWQEFHELATARKGSLDDVHAGNAAKTWSEMLALALRDDWEDRELYASFRTEA